MHSSFPEASPRFPGLCRFLPRTGCFLPEDPNVQALARSGPRCLLDGLRLPALLDGMQKARGLLSRQVRQAGLTPCA
jgi:hypothetical protein